MNWIKYPFATVAVALCLELYITPGLSTEKQGINWEVSQFQPRDVGTPPSTGSGGVRFRPRPGTQAPQSTESGGEQFLLRPGTEAPSSTGNILPNNRIRIRGWTRRSGSCVSPTEKHLTTFTPKDYVGLTVSEYPTFFGYVPQSTAQSGEFILMNQSSQVIYRTSFPIPTQPGIVSITLPAKELPPLEMGKSYQWYLVLVCNPNDRSENEISDRGWIQRTQLSQAAANQIETGKSSTLPNIYAADGIWYEALASLVALRREQPNNSQLIKDWEELLNSAGLEPFIPEPLPEN
ncbi:DUF928 domain-containing protein [Aerosakkonemataceae cyanobacterium BLCC-F154]|uniref:DUF928 domain-containing protein n=1 Tax=Floridaenema fluviatile BLCC-F154 TaxID=3153640 RepID=A0ABV4Y6F9_9CYAN